MKCSSPVSANVPAHGGWLLFPVALFLACFLSSVIIPPFQSPDEFDHVKRAYLLTQGRIVLDSPEGNSSGGMIDTGLLAYMRSYGNVPFHPDRKLSADEIDEAKSIQWAGTREFSPAPGTGYYFPLIYAPQATGLIIGEMLGVSVEQSYRLARFFVLVFASLIIAVAFLIHRPPPLVAALLVIPMSLFQFSSASLDGLSTALSILAISVFMRIAMDKKQAGLWLLHVLTGSVILVVGCRVHLLPLILLIFGTFFFTKSSKSLIAGGVASILVVLWLAVAFKSTVDNRFAAGLPVSRILFHYLANPSSFVRVLIATLSSADLARFYAQSFFGILGWLDARFPDDIYTWLYALFFLVAIFSTSFRNIEAEWLVRLLLVICAFCSILLIFLALLVTWNAHPASVIQGVQGRYFIVPALLIAYALDCSSGSDSPSLAGPALLAAFFLFSLFNTGNLLLDRYYLFAEQPQMAKFEMRATPPLTRDVSIKLTMHRQQNEKPSSLKRIAVMFGTHMRKNSGSAELRLTTKEGDGLAVSFDLSDLADNQYRWFDLDDRPYVAGEVLFSTGGGISIWEVHDDKGPVSSCLIYEFSNGSKRYTKACPRP